MNRISKIFQPVIVLPKNAVIKNQELTSKSQKLMTDVGLIRPSGNGTFFILPLLTRSVDKLTRILDHFMKEIEGQKVTMPTLTPAELWKKSGRLTLDDQPELMMLHDRHEKKLILSPTHEESITSLIASISPVTYKSFPLRIYQITPKFRDEKRPRFGLIRAKEFLMFDMYTFDLDLEEANKTYELMNEQYTKIFRYLRIPSCKIAADTGNMGGKTSHEYHLLASIGDDEVVKCTDCGKIVNKELCREDGKICDKCVPANLENHRGIEIGHTFMLEDKYSKALNATYLNKKGKPTVLQMGCYGIGVTRLIAASIEHFSDENEIRWPEKLAPYRVVIIPPKEGSKEEQQVKYLPEEIYNLLNANEHLKDDILIDDRIHMTIGKRVRDAKTLGIPFVVVVGSKACEQEPLIEVFHLNSNQSSVSNLSETIQFIVNLVNVEHEE